MAALYSSKVAAAANYPDSFAEDTYDNKAYKHNEKLIKGWMDSLKTTLIVAAIYAVILGIFVARSMDLLQPDWAAMILDVTIFMVRNGTSPPTPRYNPSYYGPRTSALTINILLYTALCIAIVTSISGVIVLLYVERYDRALTNGVRPYEEGPNKRSVIMDSATQRKINGFVVSLPMLLVISVAIGLGGILHWLVMNNGSVARVVIGTSVGSFLFYLIVSLILARPWAMKAGPEAMGQKVY